MTFVSCALLSENELDERNGPKSTSAFANFFSSEGTYYMPKCHIDGRGRASEHSGQAVSCRDPIHWPTVGMARHGLFDESGRI